jgi:tetratricopeptide (TPR) repeat protein
VGQLVSATNHDLFIETGDILAALERPDEAIKDYDEAITHLSEPDKLKTAWNNKGLALYGLKKWDEAIKCYDEALKIDPLLKESWFNKGLACSYKGDQRTASICFSKAVDLDPQYSRACSELEKMKDKMNNPAQPRGQ